MPSGVYTRTAETRMILSKARMGRQPWNKGKKGAQVCSEATKEKLRMFQKGKKRGPMSKEARENMSKSHKGIQSGAKHPMWKGGKHIDRHGYVNIHRPLHPFCNKKNYVAEHRLAMESFIGRYLKPREVVHHINGVKGDNRIENLMLFPSDTEHQKYHREGRITL